MFLQRSLNMNESVKKPAMGIMVIALVVGLVIGYGITKAVDNNHYKKQLATATVPNSTTAAADLRANLVTLGVEHMDLTDQAVDTALDGSPNAKAASADLVNNGKEISAAVGSVYGTAAQSQFQSMWDLHLGDFVKYAVAGSKNDSAGKAAALTDIQNNYTMPISKLLSGATGLPYSAVYTAFNDHVIGTAQMIDAHVSGNYTQETQLREAGAQHLEGLMSTLAGAIVKQNPSKF